jgi:hypothetical protein
MRYSLLVIGCIVVVGCTHTKELDKHSEGYAQVNREAAARTVEVTTADGRKWKADGLRIDGDFATWMDPESGNVQQVPSASIQEVQYQKRGRGALEGLAFGVLTGVVVGAVIGFADGDDEPGWFSMRAEEKAAGAGLGLGLATGLVGIPIGAVVGSTEVCRLIADSATPDSTHYSVAQRR